MTRVYAIHTGSYSDQSWGPVFSTIERALAYKAGRPIPVYFEDECDIEIYVLDDENDTGPIYPEWIVVFDVNGNVIHHVVDSDPKPFEPLLPRTEVRIPPKGNHWFFLDGPGIRDKAALVVQLVHAPDLASAVKIAADARTKYLVLHGSGA